MGVGWVCVGWDGCVGGVLGGWVWGGMGWVGGCGE